MSFKEAAALISGIIVAIGTIWYLYLVVRNQIKPVLASWIVMSGTVILSLVTYMTGPKHSLISNITNVVSVGTILSITLVVGGLSFWRKEWVPFSVFQKRCLIVAAIIAILWVVVKFRVFGIRGNAVVPNILTQVLVVIGYIPLFKKLWSAPKNTESTFTWWCVLLSSVVGLIPAIIGLDPLAIIFALRSILTTAIVVCLIDRLERKSRPEPKNIAEFLSTL